MSAVETLEALREKWSASWPDALAAWSRFTMLSPPRWCFTEEDEARESLSGSFAMIRLVDHAVVVSLRQVRDMKLDGLALPVLAHEIGHHVFAPANLTDHARLLARVRDGLPSREEYAGMVANLYTDLLINDRLQRAAGIDMAAVYKRLAVETEDPVWRVCMRMYEILWSLPSGTLTPPIEKEQMRIDAQLGAKVVRVYARDWLTGGGRFAMLLLPYFLDIPDPKTVMVELPPWFDTEQAGAGEEIPDGLAEADGDAPIHPAEDPAVTGSSPSDEKDDEDGKASAAREGRRAVKGGKKNVYRSIDEYRRLMKSVGVEAEEKDVVIRYYRERALPHLIRFPVRMSRKAADPLPEGLEVWEPGEPVNRIDWVETATRTPYVIPGVTTVQRTYGTSEGSSPERVPLDLYIGIDCSGSMSNPAMSLSWPVLAGTVVALSALRAGANVMACLSGEPGEYVETDGFGRDERCILGILTDYLGTGYAYGLERLRKTFLTGDPPKRATHLLIVSDQDIFHMLGEVANGPELIRRAVETAGGGGTFVLEIEPGPYASKINQLVDAGWNVHCVTDQRKLVEFARKFSRSNWGVEEENR